MGHYVSGPSTLALDDGQGIPPGTSFETVFRPAQEAQLLACGAITIAAVSEVFEPVAVRSADLVFTDGRAFISELAAGDPGQKE